MAYRQILTAIHDCVILFNQSDAALRSGSSVICPFDSVIVSVHPAREKNIGTLDSKEGEQATRQVLERRLLGAICFGLWIGILGFGLWPFNFRPRNRFQWLANGGISFENYGQGYSRSQWNRDDSTDPAAGFTIELWVRSRERNYHDVSGLLSIGDSLPECFAIAQSGPDVMVRGQFQDATHSLAVRRFYIDDAFPETRPRFITVASGPQGTELYLDGIPKRKVPFTLTKKNSTGTILLGHNFAGHEPWVGELLGLAIYQSARTTAEVSEDYSAWEQKNTAELMKRPRIAALYLFDEGSGNIIHNRAGDAPDIVIPERFSLLHKTFLDFPSHLNRASLDLPDIVINIIGFVPFGFFACLFFVRAKQAGPSRAILLTLIMGAITSLTIELLQAFLPTRESSLLDLINNTLGTLVGAIVHYGVATVVSRSRRPAIRLW
jgi:VanZ family protein